MEIGFFIIAALAIALIKLLLSISHIDETSSKPLELRDLHAKKKHGALFDDESILSSSFSSDDESIIEDSDEHLKTSSLFSIADDYNNDTLSSHNYSETDSIEPMNLGINPATGLPMLDDSMIDVGGNVFGTDNSEISSDDLQTDSFDHSLGSSLDDLNPFDSFDSFDSTLDDPFQSGFDDDFSSTFDDDNW